jgi:hypothetical protein
LAPPLVAVGSADRCAQRVSLDHEDRLNARALAFQPCKWDMASLENPAGGYLEEVL